MFPVRCGSLVENVARASRCKPLQLPLHVPQPERPEISASLSTRRARRTRALVPVTGSCVVNPHALLASDNISPDQLTDFLMMFDRRFRPRGNSRSNAQKGNFYCATGKRPVPRPTNLLGTDTPLVLLPTLNPSFAGEPYRCYDFQVTPLSLGKESVAVRNGESAASGRPYPAPEHSRARVCLLS